MAFRRRGWNSRRRPRRHRRFRRGGQHMRKRKQIRAMMPVFFKNPVMGQAFPDRLRMKMVYDTVINVIAVGPSNDHVYRGNDVFDPNPLIGGVTAYQFHEVVRNYSRFCVYSSSLRADMINDSGNVGVLMTIVPSSVIGSFLSVDVAIPQPWAKYPMICPIAARYPVIMKHYAASQTMLGINKIQNKDAVFCGNATASPAQQWYWHIVTTAVDGITAPTYTIRLRIVYYVEFFDKTQALI